MTRRIAYRFIALIMSALMALGAAASAQASATATEAGPTVSPAPAATQAPTSAPTVDGTVRVLLTYPNTIASDFTVTLDGSYSVNSNAGFRFERGSQLRIYVAGGEPVLSYMGMTMRMGAGFALTRHITDGENGLRIGGASGLYEGDLSVTVKDGALRPVLSIYIEDYVKGVLPYELNDSYPLETLKAQAVAARTYALKRRNSARDFDVYDNTNSQVFRGYSANNTNIERAVDETKGIVGSLDGALADCLYSASNGGQTELYKNAFGGDADLSYLTMRDDPYDLNNPESTVKSASVPKQPGLNAIPEKLDSLLKAELSEQLTALGYDDAPENISIIDVSSITPHTPKYAVPSRVFTKLRFKLRLMARKVLAAPAEQTAAAQSTPAPSAAPESSAPAQTAAPGATAQATQGALALSDAQVLSDEFTVDIDTFGGAVEALGLSINGALNNELISVRDAGDSFAIESRRFGHGLGMSQRGAQFMASRYNWDYNQILAFYYPGLKFEARAYAPAILPAITGDDAATPQPTAAPTPQPTFIPVGDLPEGAYYAEVALANAASTLNLRAEPSTNAQVVYLLMNGQPVIVLQELGDGWVKIQVGQYIGYVAAQYLKLI